jgi:hypothetical protein
LSKSGRRRLVWGPRTAQEIERLRRASERASEAITGFERVVTRIPEMGMAVPGQPGFYSRPFHTDRGSFLVIYSFDDHQVVCITLRSVPSTAY